MKKITMENKPFRFGLIVGRFQTLHIGHEDMINKAIAVCERVGILVGSSEESGNFANPFTYGQRAEMLCTVFGERISVYPLPDIFAESCSEWGDYVLDTAYAGFGMYPDLFVSGVEPRRSEWFAGKHGINVAELYIPKTINISAASMREYLVNDSFDEWKKYTPSLLWNGYSEMRKAVLASKDNLESRNI